MILYSRGYNMIAQKMNDGCVLLQEKVACGGAAEGELGDRCSRCGGGDAEVPRVAETLPSHPLRHICISHIMLSDKECNEQFSIQAHLRDST